MFVVIFEVKPRQARWDDYLATAGGLRPVLEQIDGFISNERFRSRRRPGWLLSLSVWRDEKAVIRWRTVGAHHIAQQAGREGIFEDYHLRVGEVTADSEAPLPPAQRLDATEVGAARTIVLTDGQTMPADPSAAGLVDWDSFESITTPGKLILLEAWRDESGLSVPGSGHARRVRVIRDYGLRDRREAPQFMPPVA